MPLRSSLNLKHAHCSTFVETGTFHGAGVRRALAEGYERVISIEIDDKLYKENLDRFSAEINESRVNIFLGDSAYLVSDIVSEIDEPISFWLDAHDQTMSGAGVGDCKCPIIEELDGIMRSRSLCERRMDILFIDDLRLIEDPRAGWNINIGDLYKKIWEYNPDFVITREEGRVKHDVMMCTSKFLRF